MAAGKQGPEVAVEVFQELVHIKHVIEADWWKGGEATALNW
jgi:hypothetical protein